MREIRFRGMTTNLVENEFVYGYYQKLIGYGEYDMENIYHLIINENDESNCVDEKTVGQFTGLKDKNGTDIYEGDLFEWTSTDTDGSLMRKVDVVRWEDGGYVCGQENECLIYYLKFNSSYENIELIGNIHEVSE